LTVDNIITQVKQLNKLQCTINHYTVYNYSFNYPVYLAAPLSCDDSFCLYNINGGR